METPGWPTNCGSSAFQIVRFRVRKHLHHCSLKPQTHDRGRDRTERILQAEEQILEHVEEKPEAEVGVSQFVVHPTLKEQGLHPYHVQKVQALKYTDFPRRVIYCEWLL